MLTSPFYFSVPTGNLHFLVVIAVGLEPCDQMFIIAYGGNIHVTVSYGLMSVP